jgi:hypothetical protein
LRLVEGQGSDLPAGRDPDQRTSSLHSSVNKIRYPDYLGDPDQRIRNKGYAMKSNNLSLMCFALCFIMMCHAVRAQSNETKGKLLRMALEKNASTNAFKTNVPIEKQCRLVILDKADKFSDLRIFFQSDYCLFNRKELFVLGVKRYVELNDLRVTQTQAFVSIVFVDDIDSTKSTFHYEFVNRSGTWILRKAMDQTISSPKLVQICRYFRSCTRLAQMSPYSARVLG